MINIEENVIELSNKLNNRDVDDEITPEIEEFAIENNLVIVYGASDDLMEFRGAIYGEIGCHNGDVAYLNNIGLIDNKCSNERCPYHKIETKHAIGIKAIWGEYGDEYAWVYETKLLHRTFDILDDEDDKYCRGIVFSMLELHNLYTQIQDAATQ